MRKLISLCIIIIWGTSATAVECVSSSSDGVSTALNPLSGLNSCSVTPDAIEVKLFDLGVCTSAPSVNPDFTINYSSCVSLFSDSSGRSVTLSNGMQVSLNKEVALEETTYTHGYIILGSTFAIKTKFTFNYNVATEDNALNPGPGKYCYTDGSSYDAGAPSNLTCSNDSGLPGYAASSESLLELYANYPGSGGTSNYYPNVTAVIDGINETFDLFALDSTKKIDATATYTPAQRPYMLGIQRLSSPMIVSANTTNIDARISLSNGVMLGFAPNGSDTLNGDDFDCTNVGGCLVDALWTGLAFRFVAN